MNGFGGKHTVLVSIVIFLLCAVLFLLPTFLKSSYVSPLENSSALNTVVSKPIVVHVATPEPLKALYMTSCVAGTTGCRESLKTLIEKTELNAVVIDIKDATGVISFRDEDLQNSQSIKIGCKVSDLREYIAGLHEKDIYVIGRISVFQDPYYTALWPELAVKSKSTGEAWKDHKGLAFIDVGAKPYWDYIVEIAKHSYELGFDELNFDYVRYPSDGLMSDTNYTWTIGTSTKPEMLEGFFKYLGDNLSSLGAKLSVDLFGMTTTVESDMNI